MAERNPLPSPDDRARGPLKRPRSLVDEIAARLQSDILSGRLAPGQRISAAAVSRELGVSHIPVREALRRLEADALVESSHHQGAVVSRISLDELHEIYDLRRLIEGETVRRAAARYTDDDLKAIVQAGDRLMAADPTDPSTDFWEAHRAFHWAILAPAMDSWRTRLLGALWQSAERYARLRTLVFGSPERAIADHPRLVERALQRDPERLAQALIAHLDTTEKMVTEGYRRTLVDAPRGPVGRSRPAAGRRSKGIGGASP
jgi:DNA-binding GntR family transcriptional regulator